VLLLDQKEDQADNPEVAQRGRDVGVDANRTGAKLLDHQAFLRAGLLPWRGILLLLLLILLVRIVSHGVCSSHGSIADLPDSDRLIVATAGDELAIRA